MIHRQSEISGLSNQGNLVPASGSVTTYAAGGVVATSSTGNMITLHPGHGFTAGVKFMRGIDATTYSGARTVQAVSGGILTLDVGFNYTVDAGDRLINLGIDSSNATIPNYDGSTVVTYSDPGGVAVNAQSTVSLDEGGGYEYWHKGATLWELIRGGDGVPMGLVIDSARASNLEAHIADFGAVSDGVTDDTDAFQAAVDSLYPYGGTIWLPAGTTKVTRTINLPEYTVVRGMGAYSSIISWPFGGVGTEVLLWRKSTPALYACFGIGGKDFQVHCHSQNVHGIRAYKAYDDVTFDTVHVEGVGPTASAFRFEPDPTSVNNVSQTILLNNCYAIHALPQGATGDLYYFEAVQESTLIDCKGFGGYSLGTGNCNVFHFDGCRGITMIGGAAAISQSRGIYITATTRASQGMAFYGVTLEALTTPFEADGNVFVVNNLDIRGLRAQEGAVVPATPNGSLIFDNVVHGTLDIRGWPATLSASCTNLTIITNKLSNITSASAGATNRVTADYDNTNPVVDIFAVTEEVSGFQIKANQNQTSGPTLYMGHRGRKDYYRHLWSARTPATDSDPGDNEFGYQLRYYDKTGASKNVMIYTTNGSHRHYVNNVESLKLDTAGSAETAAYLLVNDGAVTSLRRVTVGAVDSGGTGYRLLRVTN